MNKIIEQAKEIMTAEYEEDLPELEIGQVYKMDELWDGNGEVPEGSYSYQLTNSDWINYKFEIMEENEDALETIIKIIDIELL